MKSWRSALISPAAAVLDAVRLLDLTALQIALVVDEEQHLLGTITDGDVRRGIIQGIPLEAPVSRIMNRAPIAALPSDDPEKLRAKLRGLKLKHLPIVDGVGTVVGLYTVEDLLADKAPHDNWVLLMAGGQGARLRPFTETTPKPLLTIGKKPLLETILEKFIMQDFRRFYISLNYKGEMIRAHFGDGSHWGVEIRYIEEPFPMGTAGPLGLLPDRPQQPLIVMNGDLLTDVNVGAMLSYHQTQGAVATMGVREYDFQVQFGVVEIDNGRIKAINEKPVHRFLINGGIYVLSPEAVAEVDGSAALDMPQLFNQLAGSGKHTVVFPILESWLDIGRPEDLQLARSLLSKV